MSTKSSLANGEQILVRCNDREEAQMLFEWLDRHGYSNPGNITADNYRFPVVVVDKGDMCYFGTNVTCMAAAASSGFRPISVPAFITSQT